jgi:hypothetical protein
MRRAFLAILLMSASVGQGQTLVNLGSQTKNVDFSAAPETRPMKTGTALPGTCNVGDEFFNTAATAGSNVYGCTAANVWTQLSGGGGGSGVGSSTFQPFITDAQVSATATTVTLPAAIFRNNNTVTAVTSTATIQANAGSLAAGSQIWIEFDPVTKTRFLVSNGNVTQSNLTLANISAGASNASAFTSGRIPIASCGGGTTADNWTACTDARTPFTTTGFTAGAGINIAAPDSAGNQQISATGGGGSTVSNPAVYKTVINGAASCPSSFTALDLGGSSSYGFPSSAAVTTGDQIYMELTVARTGSAGSGTQFDVELAGASVTNRGNNGVLFNMGAGQTWYLHAWITLLSSSSFTATVSANRGNGGALAETINALTGVTFTSTPVLVIKGAGCSSTDTLNVVAGTITLYKAASL